MSNDRTTITTNTSTTSVEVIVQPVDISISNHNFTIGLLNRDTVVYSGSIGIAGPPDVDSFKIYNGFSEISGDQAAKQQALSNLGLQYIDGGTFN